MSVLGCDQLTTRENLVNCIAQRIRLALRAGVKKIAAGEIVFIGEFMVDPGDDIVFAGVIRGGRVEGHGVGEGGALARGGTWPEGKIRGYLGIHGDWSQ